ncbi:hypothetical protein H4R18_003109 [Coemansia javaensis]|uniref:BHLH domain-containing protein n=1 Tax=Coemansia javaensis TaxID=2761396 RepID=A0A9W8H8Z4_9FUNG|nr:hypothetical protein H4R18_003109 [Coemansia javaensis]
MTGSAAAAAAAAAAHSTSGGADADAQPPGQQPLFLTFTPALGPLSEGRRQKRKSHVYKVSGVNILNRNSVDSKTALERLQRRRENHNFVERRRRDNINHTIATLATLMPPCGDDSAKLNKGRILQMAVEHIRSLQEINRVLAAENRRLGGTGHVDLPARHPGDSQPGTAYHSHDDNDDDDDDDGTGGDDDDDMPLSSTAASSPGAALAGAKRASRRSSRCTPPREKRQAVAAPATAAASPVALPPTSALLAPPPALGGLGPAAAGHAPLPPLGAIAAPHSARAPAQSMPSSPSFRPYSAGVAGRPSDPALAQHRGAPQLQPLPHLAALGVHPFFASDVSSIRHHLSPHQPHPPQAAPMHPRQYSTQSLQSTPLIRPARGAAHADHMHALPDLGR